MVLNLKLTLAQHTVVIPIQEVPNLEIKRAIQIEVTILRIAVARQHLKRHPIDQILRIKIRCEHVIDFLRIIIECIEHLNKLRMVGITLCFQQIVKIRLIKRWVVSQLNNVLIALKLKVVHLVQMPVFIEPMGLKSRLIELLDLRKQTVVGKRIIRLFGLVAHPQMHKLRAQAHHLGNPTDKVVGHLVAKTHTLAHVLVERNRALLAPGTLALFELHLVILL